LALFPLASFTEPFHVLPSPAFVHPPDIPIYPPPPPPYIIRANQQENNGISRTALIMNIHVYRSLVVVGQRQAARNFLTGVKVSCGGSPLPHISTHAHGLAPRSELSAPAPFIA